MDLKVNKVELRCAERCDPYPRNSQGVLATSTCNMVLRAAGLHGWLQ